MLRVRNTFFLPFFHLRSVVIAFASCFPAVINTSSQFQAFGIGAKVVEIFLNYDRYASVSRYGRRFNYMY